LRDHVVAFGRRYRSSWAMVAAPRLTVSLSGRGRFPVGVEVWGRTRVALPRAAPARWTDELSGATVDTDEGAVAAGDVFATLPCAAVVEGGGRTHRDPGPGRGRVRAQGPDPGARRHGRAGHPDHAGPRRRDDHP